MRAYLNIDRDAASRLGVRPSGIDSVPYDTSDQWLISTTFTQAIQYHVMSEVAPQFQPGPQALEQLYVPPGDDIQACLPSPAKVEEQHTLLATNHIAQFSSTILPFDSAKGYSLGETVEMIYDVETSLELPLSMQDSFCGAVLAFGASLLSTLLLTLASVVTAYIVLGILYESFIHPVTILLILPSAGVGALLALMLTRQKVGIVAIIDIILLIGIVKKNAITMIDFALGAECDEGRPPHEAICQACLLRFRPTSMTTVAALLGALLLMLADGVDVELCQPLGITMAGGLLLSQVLTLLVTLVIYLYFGRLARRQAAWRRQRGLNLNTETGFDGDVGR